MKKIKILIADDEKDILNILKYSLEGDNYDVLICNDSSELIALAKNFLPDIFILDVMMPKINGFELCEKIRTIEDLKNKYIIFLTALIDEKNHLKGLGIGADDYILKPVSMNVLQAKVEKIATKINATDAKNNSQILKFKDLTIDKTAYVVSIGKTNFMLTKKEFELLYLLASKKESVLPRERILKNVWGDDVIVNERTIDVHIRKIRKKLGIDCIQTLKGVGYKFHYE